MKYKTAISTDIKVVKGYNRLLIYDFGREDYLFLPLNYIRYFDEDCRLTDYAIIDNEFIDFLSKYDYTFKIPQGLFDNIIYTHHHREEPFNVFMAFINCVNNNINFYLIIEKLQQLLTKNLVLHFDGLFPQDKIHEFIKSTLNLGFVSISVLLENIENEIIKEDLQNLYPNINFIDFNVFNKLDSDYHIPNFLIDYLYYQYAIQHNGVYYRSLFFINENTFQFSPEKNNEFSTKQLEIDFLHRAESKELTTLWHVNKDKVEVCKECEFRYMCVDYRQPVQRKDKTWYYASECIYNPYISKWKGEEGYMDLASIGVYCKEDVFVKDVQLIRNWQDKLWS